MVKGKSAEKAGRKAEKARTRNKSVITAVKGRVSRAEKAIKAKAEDAVDAVKQAASAIDKAGNKGVLHRNTVARKKSRLAKKAAASEKKK